MPHDTYPSSPLCHTIHTHPPHCATRYIPILPTVPHNTYPSSPLCHTIHTRPPHYATQYIPFLPTMPHNTYPSSPLCHTIHTRLPHYTTQYIPVLPTTPHDTDPSSPLCPIHTCPPHYARYIPILPTMPDTYPSSPLSHTSSTYMTALSILSVPTHYPPEDHLNPCLPNFRHNSMTVCCYKSNRFHLFIYIFTLKENKLKLSEVCRKFISLHNISFFSI